MPSDRDRRGVRQTIKSTIVKALPLGTRGDSLHRRCANYQTKAQWPKDDAVEMIVLLPGCGGVISTPRASHARSCRWDADLQKSSVGRREGTRGPLCFATR